MDITDSSKLPTTINLIQVEDTTYSQGIARTINFKHNGQ
jgi:hypothetical protein